MNPAAEHEQSYRELSKIAEQWAKDDPDPSTRAEVAALLSRGPSATSELADRFGASLEFGTAGLRGLLGAGPNRMNRAVVARATWGLAQDLLANVRDAARRGVVVGGDARVMSHELTEDTAAILAQMGLRVVMFRDPVATPFVAFAVKEIGAAGGVVITASHNPREYNGYKVYWENAAQIIPPIDERIAAAIDRAPRAREITRPDLDAVRAVGRLEEASPKLARAYLDAVRSLAVHPSGGDRKLRVVYTPMHGVGDPLARAALLEAGFTDVTSVPEQQKPDGAFPTVAFPNPEEPGAMDLAFSLAQKLRADLVLANDPDADRLAVATREDESWKRLTGNEVGVLLGHYLLTERTSDRPRVVLASIVSSPLLGRIAQSLGVRYEETLTGFKWIANRAMQLEKDGYAFVFGYEEALGYTAGDVVRDKDGISSAVLVAEIAAVLRGRGRTLRDELDGIARRWGAFSSRQVNFVRQGPGGLAAILRTMQGLRAAPPKRIGGDDVVALADYEKKERKDLRTGVVQALALPQSNVLTFELASGSRVIARPSGTEPKAKFYFDTREEVRVEEEVRAALARAKGHADRLADDFASIVHAAAPT